LTKLIFSLKPSFLAQQNQYLRQVVLSFLTLKVIHQKQQKTALMTFSKSDLSILAKKSSKIIKID
jgi:hypothetical protein